MGCCGCSLSVSTMTAATFGLIESIVGMAWNILFIVVMESTRIYNTTDDLTTTLSTLITNSDEISTTTTEDVSPFPDNNTFTPFERLKDTLASEAVRKEHLFEVVVTALILNCLWFITSLALSVGNSEKCKDMLKPWITATIVILFTDITACLYFTIKAVVQMEELKEKSAEEIVLGNLYVVCAILFSRGGIIIWVTNICLILYVSQRIKELKMSSKNKLPFDCDMRITPYQLQPPYEAFEADCSPHAHQTFKPHIPPPDYEGPRKSNGRTKRPITYQGEYDTTVAVSSASLGSGRSSTTKRPLSNIYESRYDSRLDTHRNSMTAENVINHAYENRGFDVQSETWTGIPRPSFKPR